MSIYYANIEQKIDSNISIPRGVMKGKGLFMGNKWLDCTISPGQFTGEFAVQGELFDNTGFSLFATKEDLKFEGKPASDKPVSGFIKITPLMQENDLQLVSLPRPTLENGRSITVRTEHIKEIC